MATTTPSALPLECGGVASVDFNRTHSGVPYVTADAAGYGDCQMLCCADTACRGWVFRAGGGGGACALLADPGAPYNATGLVSGAFSKAYVPAPDEVAPQYSFEAAFVMATLLLVGSFGLAVWYLRREGGGAAGGRRGLSLQGVLRAVRKRQRYRLAEGERAAAAAAAAADVADGGDGKPPGEAWAAAERRGGWGRADGDTLPLPRS